MGFEPMTSCLLDRRSNQLSYGAHEFEPSQIYHTILSQETEVKQKQANHHVSPAGCQYLSGEILQQ